MFLVEICEEVTTFFVLGLPVAGIMVVVVPLVREKTLGVRWVVVLSNIGDM